MILRVLEFLNLKELGNSLLSLATFWLEILIFIKKPNNLAGINYKSLTFNQKRVKLEMRGKEKFIERLTGKNYGT